MLRCQRLILVSCAALAAASCSRDESGTMRESISPGVPDPGGADILDAQTAESSLAIKRGSVVSDSGSLTLRPCGETVELAVQDHSGVLAELVAGGELETDRSIYVEAYGERSAGPQQLGGMAGVFVLERLLYAAPQSEIPGCDQPQPDYVVAARGNEPFWGLQVTEAQMVWRQPEAPQEITFEGPEAQPAEGTVQYLARAAGHEVELLVGEQHCRDTMSGEFFAYTARAVLDGREFTGCARVGQ